MNTQKGFVRIYFYKSNQLKEPKNRIFKFNYGPYKSTFGLSSFGFYFDLPFSNPIKDVTNTQLSDDFFESKSQRDMFNCGIDCGTKLYSLAYGKRMPDLKQIYLRLPNGEAYPIPFSLTSLLGTGEYKFNKKFISKKVASTILSFRKKDKEKNAILNSIILGGLEPSYYLKFSHVFPAVEPLSRLDGFDNKAGDIGYIRKFWKNRRADVKIETKEGKLNGRAKHIRAWLVEQAFSFIGKHSSGCSNHIFVNKEETKSNPDLKKAIKEYKEKNSNFECTPMGLLLAYAPYRFRCDYFHGNEPELLYLANNNEFYKGIGIFTNFLLSEIETDFIKYLKKE